MKNLLQPLPSTTGSIAVLILFTVFFALLCWFVYRRDRKAIYAHLESLPIQEEDKV
jgi:cbb3-type cytochrome oxidase subunit 3